MRSGSIFALSFAAACASPELDEARAAIKGGVEDSLNTAVVGIIDNGTNAECTGTLIAPTLVLTAQHCVAATPPIMDCQTVMFGAVRPPSALFVTTQPAFTANVRDYRAVREIVLPPGEQRVCGQDVALIVLSAAIPSGEATPIAARTDTAPAPGETYSAVGYGATSSVAGAPTGTRRRRDGLVVNCIGPNCPGMFAATEWLGDQGVCMGDSGGPALDASGRVIGVLSRAAFDCTRPTYSLLPAYAAWIAAELARAGGVVVDAGIVDSGEPSEAGFDAGFDSGFDSGSDAQVNAQDAEPMLHADASEPVTRDEGCSCTSMRSSYGRPEIVLLLVLALSLRRRS